MVRATSQRFGVISDFSDREDVPTLKIPNVYHPESSGTFLQYGMLRTMPGCNGGAFINDSDVKVQVTDGNPVIHHHRHVSGAGVEYVFQYTKAHVYLWDQSTRTYTTMFTCASDCTLWDTVSLSGKIISTNGVDFVQVWDETTPATVFAAFDTVTGIDIDGAGGRLTRAKYLGAYEGILVLGGLTEDGTLFPRRVRLSTLNAIDDFDVNGTGDTKRLDFEEGSDVIKGFGNYTFANARIFVIFKEESVYKLWLVEGLGRYGTARTEGKVGLLATHSVINDQDGNLYYLADDFTVRKFGFGVVSQAKAVTLRGMNVTTVVDVEAVFMRPYNQIWWSIPSTAGSTTLDAVIALSLDYNVWHQFGFAIRSFGRWSQQETTTIDGLDTLSTTIDGLDAQLPSIDFIEGIVGFKLDLASDYSGYTYVAHASESDKGVAISRSFVISVDLTQKRSLNFFKRSSRSKAYFAGRSTTGTLSLSVKKDNQPNYTLLGSLSLESLSAFTDVDLPYDIRAKHFLFKVEGTILFDFIGMFWTFEFDGEF